MASQTTIQARHVYDWNGELIVEEARNSADGRDNIKLYKGTRVGVSVLLKRVPASAVNGPALDFNVNLSAAMQNELRYRGAGEHMLRTLTCQQRLEGPEQQRFLYIAMELCDHNVAQAVSMTRAYINGLRGVQCLDTFDEDAAPLLLWRARRSVARQLLSAVAYLHRGATSGFKRVYHRNLKPSNVLLKNGIVKLSEVNFYAQPESSGEGGWDRVPDDDGVVNSGEGSPGSPEHVLSTPVPQAEPVSEWAPRMGHAEQMEEAALAAAIQALGLRDDAASMQAAGRSPLQGQAVPGLPPSTIHDAASALRRLYRLRAHRDCFAVGSLIFYVLTLGKHPLGTMDGKGGAGSALSAMKRRAAPDFNSLSTAMSGAAMEAAKTTAAVADALESGAAASCALRPAPVALKRRSSTKTGMAGAGTELASGQGAQAQTGVAKSDVSMAGQPESTAVKGPAVAVSEGGAAVDGIPESDGDGDGDKEDGEADDKDDDEAGEYHEDEDEDMEDITSSAAAMETGPDDVPEEAGDPRASHSFSTDGLLPTRPKGLMSSGSGLLAASSSTGRLAGMDQGGAAPSSGAGAMPSYAAAVGPVATEASPARSNDPAEVLRRTSSTSDVNPHHHQHYASLADTVDWFEAVDLIQSLMRPDHSQRMLPADALAHPFFWSTSRKFLLITLASEGTVVQQDKAKGRHAAFAAGIQKAFMQHLPSHGRWSPIFPAPPGMGPQGWNNPAWFHRDPFSYEEVYKGPYSCYSLVRYIRNMYIHGPSHIRDGLFPSQSHLEQHALGAFPWLVLELWKVDREVNGGRFTAQALSGGTARVIVGDAGVDAEYDQFDGVSAFTAHVPGAAGERQSSNMALVEMSREGSFHSNNDQGNWQGQGQGGLRHGMAGRGGPGLPSVLDNDGDGDEPQQGPYGDAPGPMNTIVDGVDIGLTLGSPGPGSGVGGFRGPAPAPEGFSAGPLQGQGPQPGAPGSRPDSGRKPPLLRPSQVGGPGYGNGYGNGYNGNGYGYGYDSRGGYDRGGYGYGAPQPQSVIYVPATSAYQVGRVDGAGTYGRPGRGGRRGPGPRGDRDCDDDGYGEGPRGGSGRGGYPAQGRPQDEADPRDHGPGKRGPRRRGGSDYGADDRDQRQGGRRDRDSDYEDGPRGGWAGPRDTTAGRGSDDDRDGPRGNRRGPRRSNNYR